MSELERATGTPWTSADWLAEARRYITRSYGSELEGPVIERAEGATITDVDGKTYLDFSSGQMSRDRAVSRPTTP